MTPLPNFTLMTRKKVIALLHAPGSPEVIEGVVCRDGSYYQADKVILAAGAMTSPRILQDHLAVSGLGATLPCARMVGANFKLHLNSALVAFSPFTHHDVLRKTAIFFNDRHPHTTVQCLGWMDGEILGDAVPSAVPKFVTNAIGARAFGFFVTTEDGSHPDNRIITGGGDGGIPTADYSLERMPASQAEHQAARPTSPAGCCTWASPASTAISGSPAAPMRWARWSPAATRRPASSTRTARSTAWRASMSATAASGAREPGQPGADDLRLGSPPRRPSGAAG